MLEAIARAWQVAAEMHAECVYGGTEGMPCKGVAIGSTRACPDCGRPQHYTGTEYGWAHDALTDTWHCNDPRKAGA